MTVFRDALRRHLAGLAGVGDVCVSDTGESQVHLNFRPGEAGLPAVTITGVSHRRWRDLDSGLPCGTSREEIQVDVWAKEYQTCTTVARKIRGTVTIPSLDGYRGVMQEYVVDDCAVEEAKDEYKPPVGGEFKGVHRVMLTVNVMYQELSDG